MQPPPESERPGRSSQTASTRPWVTYLPLARTGPAFRPGESGRSSHALGPLNVVPSVPQLVDHEDRDATHHDRGTTGLEPELSNGVGSRAGTTTMTWLWITLAAVGAEVVLGIVIGKMIRGPLPPPAAGRQPITGRPEPADQVTDPQLVERIHRMIDDRSLVTVFQPIVVSTTGATLGFEALSRFAHIEPNSPPQTWFARADQTGLGIELEILAAEMALDMATVLPGHGYVSLNLSPAAIATDRLGAMLGYSGWPANRTVVEIAGPISPGDHVRFADNLSRLRHAGTRIAIGYTGSGPADFGRILSMRPDLIKVDRSLVTHADTDQSHRAVIAAGVGLAHELGAVVIAEGVQTTEELKALQTLGVDAVQGFLIGEPDLAGAWASRLRRPTDAHRRPAQQRRTEPH